MISEVSKRYARALYECAQENKTGEAVFGQLSSIASALNKDQAIRSFIASPVVPPSYKIEAFDKAMSSNPVKEVKQLIHLLIEKNRIEILSEITEAYELISDEAQGISRGEVRSAAALNADEKHRLEQTINSVTKKKVILNFVEDKKILGGLVAQVGGWTFDDSLQSHLTRLTEDLNRRTH